MDGTFEPTESVIAGEWGTDAQTGGKFLLVQIETQQVTQPSAAVGPAGSGVAPTAQTTPPANASIPALVTKTVVLGSYRLNEQSVRLLASLVKSGTNVAVPAINASYRGTEHIHIGVDNLLADPNVPNVIYDLIHCCPGKLA